MASTPTFVFLEPMVAAVDIFVVFASPALRQAYEEHLERRTELGSGKVEVLDLDRPLPFGLDAVRVVAGSAPLGFVAESSDQALLAIRAGADEADVLGPPDLERLTNFLDRVRLGYVIDFIDWHLADKYHWPTFNVADAAISIGVVLLLLENYITPAATATVPPPKTA